MTNRKIAETSLISAAAIVLGYVETLVPLVVPIPGVKIGLSNLAVVFAIYRLGTKNSIYVTALKIIVTALLFSGMGSLPYSILGGFLSFFTMTFSRKFFSVKSVSAIGGIFHTIGQLIAAAVVLKSSAVLWYLPYLLTGGAVTGLLIGTVCEKLLKISGKYPS